MNPFALLAFWLTLCVTVISGYITHIIWLFKTLLNESDPATMGEIVFAIIGALVPPIGTIHGITLWF